MLKNTYCLFWRLHILYNSDSQSFQVCLTIAVIISIFSTTYLFGREKWRGFDSQRIKHFSLWQHYKILVWSLCGREYPITICINNSFMCINKEKTWSNERRHAVHGFGKWIELQTSVDLGISFTCLKARNATWIHPFDAFYICICVMCVLNLYSSDASVSYQIFLELDVLFLWK